MLTVDADNPRDAPSFLVFKTFLFFHASGLPFSAGVLSCELFRQCAMRIDWELTQELLSQLNAAE